MAKKMDLIVQRPDPVTGRGVRVDLSIEKDAGNPIRILMGGKDARQNWEELSELCRQALSELEPAPEGGDRAKAADIGTVRVPKGSITFKNLVETAKALRSEDGDNKQYDRALCELVGDAMGTTQEGYPQVAAMLGVSTKVWE